MKKTKKVIIFGIGQIAELAVDLILENDNFSLEGFCVDNKHKNSDNFLGYPLHSFENIDKKFPIEDFFFITALSYNKLNSTRENVYKKIKNLGYQFINLISKNSNFKADKIGENNIIFEYNNIQKGVEIGNNCIFWSGNHIGHHSKIGNNCFISSHVVISGSVNLGDNTFIGVNSTIRDNVTIGDKCIVGPSSIILKNLSSNSVIRPKQSEISKVSSDKII